MTLVAEIGDSKDNGRMGREGGGAEVGVGRTSWHSGRIIEPASSLRGSRGAGLWIAKTLSSSSTAINWSYARYCDPRSEETEECPMPEIQHTMGRWSANPWITNLGPLDPIWDRK